jgi:hypothetical protein
MALDLAQEPAEQVHVPEHAPEVYQPAVDVVGDLGGAAFGGAVADSQPGVVRVARQENGRGSVD